MPEATPFARICERLKPGATGSDIAELLDHRVARQVALNWRSGRRSPPQWAIDRLTERWEAIDAAAREAIAAIPRGPTRKAGALNIRRYNAHRA